MSHERAIIIGGGQAGAQAAMSLRQAAFSGDIDIFCAEPETPYQRPPLSKAYLKGDLARERLYFRPPEFYDANKISLHRGRAVVAMNAASRTINTSDGVEHQYTKLLIATGAPPRRLKCPGADLENIHYLRTLADSDALRSVCSANGPVAIIGAGYIGLEVAAVLRAFEREIIVIEAADRVLARVASEPISKFFERRHREAGVDLRLGARLTRFAGNGGVDRVILDDGSEIGCAAALVGIGAVPETALAEASGLRVDNGVVVEDGMQTSDPAIWAAGDCVNFFSERYDRRVRLESVPNAIEQAKVAALNMAGGEAKYTAVPWFWSDQYDVKLQTVGLLDGFDQCALRGRPAESRFSAWYFKDGVLLAADAVNDPAAFMAARKCLELGLSPAPAQLEDPAFDLKSLLKGTPR